MKNENNKSHAMTNEEKEKFLNRVKIETEDICESTDPKDLFRTQLKTYQEGMIQQVVELENLIKVQQFIVDYEKGILDNIKENDLDYKTLKSEIATKEEIIAKATASKLIMQERIKLGAFLITKSVTDFTFLSQLDFYLGGVLGMPGLEEKKQEIINKNLGK